jgi:hypothetical protein
LWHWISCRPVVKIIVWITHNSFPTGRCIEKLDWHSNAVQNSQKLGTTQVTINRRMEKCSNSRTGLLHGNENEWATAVHSRGEFHQIQKDAHRNPFVTKFIDRPN